MVLQGERRKFAEKTVMKSLIKGQTIRMDNHHQGDNMPIYYDEALHLHKIMNRKPYAGAEVRFPLKGERNFEITKIRSGKNEKVAKTIDTVSDKVVEVIQDEKVQKGIKATKKGILNVATSAYEGLKNILDDKEE